MFFSDFFISKKLVTIIQPSVPMWHKSSGCLVSWPSVWFSCSETIHPTLQGQCVSFSPSNAASC